MDKKQMNYDICDDDSKSRPEVLNLFYHEFISNLKCMCVEMMEEKQIVFDNIDKLFNEFKKNTENGENKKFEFVATDIYEKKEKKTLEKIKKVVGEVVDKRTRIDKEAQQKKNKFLLIMNIILCAVVVFLIIFSIISWIPSYSLLFGGKIISSATKIRTAKSLIIDTKDDIDLISVMGDVDDIDSYVLSSVLNNNFAETIKQPLLLNRKGLWVPKIFNEKLSTKDILSEKLTASEIFNEKLSTKDILSEKLTADEIFIKEKLNTSEIISGKISTNYLDSDNLILSGNITINGFIHLNNSNESLLNIPEFEGNLTGHDLYWDSEDELVRNIWSSHDIVIKVCFLFMFYFYFFNN
jgi:hypothetical protein